jgi:hypothetical protein
MARHLRECESCAELLRRREVLVEALRASRCQVQPDVDFARRVVARLESRTADILGWAALKLLPPTVAATLVLSWLAATALAESDRRPTENLVTWVYDASAKPERGR